MSGTEELNQELKPDFHVRLQSDNERVVGDPGMSLFAEIRTMRRQLEAFANALRSLVDVMREIDRRITTPVDGGSHQR